MAEKIVIAELELNTKALQESNTKLIQDITKLREEQKSLKKETGNLSNATDEQARKFIENDAALKKLSGQYNTNKKVLAENTTGVKGLNDALSKEVTNVNEATVSNKELKIIRNQINTETEAGREAIEQINDKISKNTELIKENVSELEKQKINIGNYKDSIKEAFSEIDLFNGGLGGFIARSKEVGGAGNLVTTSLKSMVQGVIGLTKATLSFIATPIGALLALLVGAFALVKSAMSRSEDATNKIKRAFSAFQGIINTLLKFLQPLGEFLIDGIVKGFELVEKAIYKGLDAIASGLELLGFDEQAKSLRNFNKEVQQGAASAKALADAEARLSKEQRKSQLIQLEYQRNAEKLRQIRDNENLTIRERIKANDELGKILKIQLEEELKIAQLNLEVANLRLKQEGETEEALNAQAEALTTIADIQERITGQESEQLTNRVALQKEARDKAKEQADKAIAEQEAQLKLFIEQQGRRAKTLQEQLVISKQVYEREVEILKANLKNRNITQTEFDAELLALKNNLLEEQTNLAVSNAERELQIFKDSHQSKLDANTFFTEELLNQETLRLDAIAEKEREYHEARLEQGVINQQEYNDAINEVDEENRISKEEAQTLREEAEAEKKIIDLENQRLIDEENFLTEFEIQSQRLETQRLQEVANAKKQGADIDKINTKFNLRQEKLEKKQQLSKIQNTQNTFNQIGGLLKGFFGENKGLNIALATADMILGIQKAYVSQLIPGDPTSLPRAIGAGVQAGVFGAANVAKVAGVKFEKGGLQEIGGKRHSQGGTKFYGEDGTAFEAEQGELIGVMNRNASRLFMEFNDRYRNGGIVNRNIFATGGIVQRQFAQQNTSSQGVDYDLFAQKVGQVVSSEINKVKVVAIESDITDAQTKQVEVEAGANN